MPLAREERRRRVQEEGAAGARPGAETEGKGIEERVETLARSAPGPVSRGEGTGPHQDRGRRS